MVLAARRLMSNMNIEFHVSASDSGAIEIAGNESELIEIHCRDVQCVRASPSRGIPSVKSPSDPSNCSTDQNELQAF
jgi:hypothetical protein